VSLVLPDDDRPFITPYCGLCDQPVERLQFDLKSRFAFGIEAQCCGKTASVRLPIADFLRMKETSEKFYIIMPRRRSQGLRRQLNR
jgi:hypothetical protein